MTIFSIFSASCKSPKSVSGIPYRLTTGLCLMMYCHDHGGLSNTWCTVHTLPLSTCPDVRCLTCTYFHQMKSSFSMTGPSRKPQICGSVVISQLSLPHCLTLCLLSHRVGDGRPAPPPPPPPTHPPPHYLLYLMGPILFPPPLSLSTFIYIFIYFTPALRVTVFNIIGET